MVTTADTTRKYLIIAAIALHDAPTLADISLMTGIPQSSLKRHIAQLRADYGMEIEFVISAQNKSRAGYYLIKNWGVLSREEFLFRHGAILGKK